MVTQHVTSVDPALIFERIKDLFFYEYIPGEGDTVVDLGASVGYEALYSARLVGASGTVIAIEAHPATFTQLKVLVEENPAARVVPIHAAAADRDGSARISLEADVASNIFNEGDNSNWILVPARRLDSLLLELQIASIDLLRINIEGAEVLALEGMGTLLHRTRHVAIECHDFLADRGQGDHLRTRSRVVELLGAAGFDVLPARPPDGRSWIPYFVYARNENGL